jgi:D-tagatose-1,6-bisphosphate aldolase subunit GatZ/KbaZ
MKAMLDLVARHKSGQACGIYSVCSAHPLVIEASFAHALKAGVDTVLIEATCNQVNQDGGYTGMTPKMFRDFVHAIADKVGLSRDRVLLGGDHLGPNPWTSLGAEEAMQKAEVLIEQYVAAGFRKIHADCSMSCADDPTSPAGRHHRPPRRAPDPDRRSHATTCRRRAVRLRHRHRGARARRRGRRLARA